jgi:hypothetical protein
LQDVALSDTLADKLHTVVKEQADKVHSRKSMNKQSRVVPMLMVY